jgi:hypothetical protein
MQGLESARNKLNMELDLQSLFGLHAYSCTHRLRPRNSPLPPHLGSYSRAPMVSQDRRHLFVTPCCKSSQGLRYRTVLFWNKYFSLVAVVYMQRKLVFTLTHTQSHTHLDNILLTQKSLYQLIQTAPDIDILGIFSTLKGL